MNLPGRCNLGARHAPGHRDVYGDDVDVDGDDDSDDDDYYGAGVIDADDNCEAPEQCANLRSVDRFVGALRNVHRACSYSSLGTLIIFIIVHDPS